MTREGQKTHYWDLSRSGLNILKNTATLVGEELLIFEDLGKNYLKLQEIKLSATYRIALEREADFAPGSVFLTFF